MIVGVDGMIFIELRIKDYPKFRIFGDIFTIINVIAK